MDKSDESPQYQHVLALCAFLTRVISDWFFLGIFFVCMFIFVSRLILWILQNFLFLWLLCGIIRRWIDVCFKPWCNPLWLTGLKAPTNFSQSWLRWSPRDLQNCFVICGLCYNQSSWYNEFTSHYFIIYGVMVIMK